MKRGNAANFGLSGFQRDVTVHLHGQFKAAMPRQILNDAGIDAGENGPCDVGMPEIVQAVAAGQAQAVLDPLPAAVKGFGRGVDAEGRRRKPIAAAQDREQLRRDREITHACGALGCCVDQFAADAVADAANVKHVGHQIHVTPLQAGDFGAAKPREQSQR